MNEKFLMFTNRLSKVYKHVGKQAKKQGITCYRVYDHDIPEFPLCIEFYEDNLYIAEYKRRHNMTEEEHELWLEEVIVLVSELLQVHPDNIYLRQRQRKPGRLGQYQRVAEKEEFFTVNENGLQFKVNLTDYLDTGLFLDHRVTRSMVREQAADKRVLNLFCYTGSFSVYAAAGNAAKVTSVDLSKTYLAWARDNMKLNGFLKSATDDFVHADVMQWLGGIAPDSYDLIVMDPPTFSNSKRMKDFLDIQRDHVLLINQVMSSLANGGVLFFSTNFTRFQLDRDNIRAQVIKDITRLTTPFDFQGKLKRWCFRMEK